VALGGGAFSYERGTLVKHDRVTDRTHSAAIAIV